MPRLNALVIGNAKYDHAGSLKNPTNDAEDIAKVLANGGFSVTALKDVTFREMKKALKAFEESANENGTVSVFFFAGHGVEVDGVNYLFGKDTETGDETDVATGALSLLEQYPEFDESFDFITGALASKAHQLFAIPGKGQQVSVDVHIDEKHAVENVFVAGKDHLSEEDDPFDFGDGTAVRYRTIKREEFETELAHQMLVPRRLLKVSYNRVIKTGGSIKLRYGLVVSRPG
jgi:hypothetical protein